MERTAARFTRLELHEGPDSHGRYFYTLFRMADYHPGHPLGEYRTAERGQCYFADPRQHAPYTEEIVYTIQRRGDNV